ncbi:MAG: FtsK/SpoIIIE domain-containing protein, partial [Candidatus Bostrichicola ureolyticus]
TCIEEFNKKTCIEEFNKKEFNKEEFNKKVEYNKYKIVEIFKNYKIEIKNIKATIGHQITLYEIVPEVGVRIAKIKNLENEIALNLSAIYVRIIAPIPGQGTIGIEIPNKNPIPVYIKHVILSPIFKKAIMELPIIIGINIYNKPFIVDLTKMPHLLIAGATGQGKSVGLNAIIISLLCKKKHYELKFVMIDTKKVELYQYKKIDFFLAKIPNDDEYIITDANRAKDVLNALCKEMDRRYNILKKKMVRNIQEYNKKYKILPYIVLIIDEFADLIINVKEIEIYILRLSRLSRAVGIHLIIATQRPSVNIITGIIKANFPSRIAFKVASKVDSITILDTIGADKLMGKGDMLFYNGSEIIRLQCPFIDTHDIETIINNYKKTNKIMKNDNFKLPMPD